jgi:hypothetical protein
MASPHGTSPHIDGRELDSVKALHYMNTKEHDRKTPMMSLLDSMNMMGMSLKPAQVVWIGNLP